MFKGLLCTVLLEIPGLIVSKLLATRNSEPGVDCVLSVVMASQTQPTLSEGLCPLEEIQEGFTEEVTAKLDLSTGRGGEQRHCKQ